MPPGESEEGGIGVTLKDVGFSRMEAGERGNVSVDGVAGMIVDRKRWKVGAEFGCGWSV